MMSIESGRQLDRYTIDVFMADPLTGKLLLVGAVTAPTNKQCRRQWDRIVDVREFDGFSVFWALFTERGEHLDGKMIAFENVEELERLPIGAVLDNVRKMDCDYEQFYQDIAEIEEWDTREVEEDILAPDEG